MWIEEDQVWGGEGKAHLSHVPGGGHVGLEAGGTQRRGEFTGQTGVVFDDEGVRARHLNSRSKLLLTP